MRPHKIIITLIIVSQLTTGCIGNSMFKSSEQERLYISKYRTKRPPLYNPGGAKFTEQKEFYKRYVNSQQTGITANNAPIAKDTGLNADPKELKKITSANADENYNFDISRMEGAKFIDQKERKKTNDITMNKDKTAIMERNLTATQKDMHAVSTINGKTASSGNVNFNHNAIHDRINSQNAIDKPKFNTGEIRKDFTQSTNELNIQKHYKSSPVPVLKNNEKIAEDDDYDDISGTNVTKQNQDDDKSDVERIIMQLKE